MKPDKVKMTKDGITKEFPKNEQSIWLSQGWRLINESRRGFKPVAEKYVEPSKEIPPMEDENL